MLIASARSSARHGLADGLRMLRDIERDRYESENATVIDLAAERAKRGRS